MIPEIQLFKRFENNLDQFDKSTPKALELEA